MGAPVLQKRGLLQKEHAGATLRENLLAGWWWGIAKPTQYKRIFCSDLRFLLPFVLAPSEPRTLTTKLSLFATNDILLRCGKKALSCPIVEAKGNLTARLTPYRG